jgi:diacylglycerol kinase
MEQQPKISQKKKFSMIARIRSTDNAWRGLWIMFKTTHNAWIEVTFGAFAIYLGFLFRINSIEWSIIAIAIMIVIITETINTAIEVDTDLTSPGYHPMAKDIKDISAGAVALACILAGILGLLIFGPKVLAIL